MASRQGSGTGDQQQTWTGPENIWMTSIREWYPRLHQDTYFMPPINPPPQPQQAMPHPPSLPPPRPQVAGTLFVENPQDLQPQHVPESDWQDDEAHQRSLQSLSKICGQTMMVVSNLTYRKYLHNENNPQGLTNPLHAVAIAQLPTASSLPDSIADGEYDVIVIHRTHGFVVAEIASVGGAQNFSDLSPDQQNQMIVDRVRITVNQLQNQRTSLKLLVSDLPIIKITLTLLLPNITRAQLSAALTTSPELTQTLCRTLSVDDVDQAMNRCLCQDLLDQPSKWWDVLYKQGPDPCMTPEVYERLVARFCGPARTIDVPTVSLAAVRTHGDAVVETGLRFSTISLTFDQLEVLNRRPRPKYLYLQGPPGKGKTVVLFLAALESAKQGHKVVIAHMPGDVAVATLLKLQLTSIVGKTTAAQLIHLHTIDFGDCDLDVNADVATLRQQVGQEDNVHIIVDEVPDSGIQFLPWVTAVGSTWPQTLLWMAGLWIRDNTAFIPSYRLPQWMETATLQVSVTALSANRHRPRGREW